MLGCRRCVCEVLVPCCFAGLEKDTSTLVFKWSCCWPSSVRNALCRQQHANNQLAIRLSGGNGITTTMQQKHNSYTQ